MLRRKLIDLTDRAAEKQVQNLICSYPRNQVNKGLIEETSSIYWMPFPVLVH